MEVTGKPLVSSCDSVYKQNINQRKRGLPRRAIIPHGTVPVRVKWVSTDTGNCFTAHGAWSKKLLFFLIYLTAG